MLRKRHDFGIFPETFIMPTGANRPPIFSKDFYTLLRRRIVQTVRDFGGILYYKYQSITPRPTIKFQATKSVAIGLHRQMYEAFAAGDAETIKNICTDGLRDTLLIRLQKRKPGETMTWELVKEGWSRVVSHRATTIFENSGVRQAVVRIRSVQRLTRYDKDGNVIGGSGKAKDVTEYIVIQKRTMDGEEDPSWMVWGTTTETTIAKLEKEKEEQNARFGL